MVRGQSEIDGVSWQAVLKRDRLRDGQFVYLALTTGVYCRPSCPARHPHRRNALLLGSAPEAERLGYAACRRCHPDSLAPAERSIKAALLYIEVHLDQTITLNTLSQVSGLSPKPPSPYVPVNCRPLAQSVLRRSTSHPLQGAPEGR
jgi:AraC family transcriptional regulator of adaptative response/methylated-DNA-[protein]-cysteine methyltransferase